MQYNNKTLIQIQIQINKRYLVILSMISVIRNCCTRIGSFLSNPKQDQKLAAKNRIRHEMHIKPDHIVEKKQKRRYLSIIEIDINRTNRKNNNIRYSKHNKQDVEGE